MIRAVLDVNVLVSAFPARESAPAQIRERWLANEFTLCLSDHILEGKERAFAKPYWRCRVSEELVRSAVRLLTTKSELVRLIDTVHGVAEDREDDLVLATAITGRADVLVTGDRLLREIDRYDGVCILTPRQFLDVLDRKRESQGGRVSSVP